MEESLEGKETKLETVQPQTKNIETAENAGRSSKKERTLDGKVNESDAQPHNSAKESSDEPEPNSSTKQPMSNSEEESDAGVCQVEDMSTPEDVSQAEEPNRDGEISNFDGEPGNSSNEEALAADQNSRVEQAIGASSKKKLNSQSECSVDTEEGDQSAQQEESDPNEAEGSMYSEDENDPEEYEEAEEEEAPIINRRCHFGDSDEGISERDSYNDSASQAASEREVLDSKADGNASRIQDDNVKAETAEIKRGDRHDPTFVPREGAFYLHDIRDESSNRSPETPSRPARKVPDRPGINNTKWSHDLYKETEQRPRSTNEIISRYGYNIREQGLEHAENASPASVQRRANTYRRGGRCQYPRRERNSPRPPVKSVIFVEKEFPSLQEAEDSNNRGQMRAIRSAPVHGPRRHPRRPGFTFSAGEGAKQLKESGSYCSSRRHFNSSNGTGRPEMVDFHRNYRGGPAMNLTVQNRGGKRYSSNRPLQGDNQPQEVVIKVQPGAQRPHNKPFRNPRGISQNQQRNKPDSKAVKSSKGRLQLFNNS